jgi:hypothetical protein
LRGPAYLYKPLLAPFFIWWCLYFGQQAFQQPFCCSVSVPSWVRYKSPRDSSLRWRSIGGTRRWCAPCSKLKRRATNRASSSTREFREAPKPASRGT